MNNISLEAARIAVASSTALNTQRNIHYYKVPSSCAVGSPQVLQRHCHRKEYCMCGKRQMCHLLKGKWGAKPKIQLFNFSLLKRVACASSCCLTDPWMPKGKQCFNFSSLRIPNCSILFIKGKWQTLNEDKRKHSLPLWGSTTLLYKVAIGHSKMNWAPVHTDKNISSSIPTNTWSSWHSPVILL